MPGETVLVLVLVLVPGDAGAAPGDLVTTCQ